ncbi:hypothetical protein [uncultured Tessaracoccus sp.]|uniref:hypothetical protein n=1 Tax=uncultured Tessaracoccus sp. TaxID=905023 RepID=UPI0025EF8E07|nr:hypothetical protein [uncultured Tessaracoccus sp.]
MTLVAGCAAPDGGSTDPAASNTPQSSASAASAPTRGDLVAKRAEEQRRFFELNVACVEEDGWELEVDRVERSFTVAGGVPEEQQQAWEATRKRCEEQFAGQKEPQFESRDDPRWPEAHELQRQLAECLRNEGYEIPEPPTLDVFVDQAMAGDWWLAWAHLPELDETAHRHLMEVCPE